MFNIFYFLDKFLLHIQIQTLSYVYIFSARFLLYFRKIFLEGILLFFVDLYIV